MVWDEGGKGRGWDEGNGWGRDEMQGRFGVVGLPQVLQVAGLHIVAVVDF